MASPLITQAVDDLKQNFFWSYISENEEDTEVLNLEITVAQFLDYIDIDLFSVDPYTANDLVSLYYGMNTKSSDPALKYFTYMLANSEINGMGVIVNLGIISNPDEYLLLEEGPGHSAINTTQFNTRKNRYLNASIYSPYINETMDIYAFSNHPLMCSFPKEDFRNFILDNMSSPTMDLSTLKLVFKMGATFLSGVNADYKIETAIVITKDSTGLRLDATNYTGKPFQFKAMDFGALCPPHCNN